MNLSKRTALFSLFVGIVNVFVWIMLAVTDQIPDIEQKLIHFLFHWTSEFSMAGLLILAGYHILTQHPMQKRVYYFATGMLMIAIIGMMSYYLFIELNWIFIVMGALITGISAFLAYKNYTTLVDFFYFTMGSTIYVGLNILGNTLQAEDFLSFIYALLGFLVVLTFMGLVFKKELSIEE